MTFREIIACVLLQRILRLCKTPHYAKCHMAILNRGPTPNHENQATTPHTVGKIMSKVTKRVVASTVTAKCDEY